MNTQKRKVGRPRKQNFIPTINLVYSDNLLWDVLRIKRQLGMPLTLGELNGLINHDLAPYRMKATITITPKQYWYKRIINWFRNKFNK